MSTPAKKKLGLLPKLIIAIALGLIVGTLARKFDFRTTKPNLYF